MDLVFREDFDGEQVPAGVEPYPDGWRDTSKNGRYAAPTVHDSCLDLHLRSDADGPLVCAPLMVATRGQTHGQYVVRWRADVVPGFKVAWLLWPDSERWPEDGEIDFPECNLDGTDTVRAFVHHARGQEQCDTGVVPSGWHTSSVLWTSEAVVFTLDDRVIGQVTSNLPTGPMHWVLQTETNTDGWLPDPTVEGHVLIDWIEVWS